MQIGVDEDSKGRLLGEYLLRRNGAPDFAVHLDFTKVGYTAINLVFATLGWEIFNQSSFPSLD